MENRQIVIIGAGPAGLTAAIYARRAGMDVLLLERGVSGGQINSTAEVENYPGFKVSSGLGLGQAFREHAERFGAEFRDCSAESVSFSVFEQGDKIIRTDRGGISADALIICSGSTFKRAGCKGEMELAGHGVSYCAVCDGVFYEGAPVAVIGGGNAAVEEAEYLAKFASKVYLIHRGEEFRAQRVLVERALCNPRIEPVMGCVVDEIEGKDMVERVVVRGLRSGETRTVSVEGVFVFVGTAPNVDFLKDSEDIRMDGPGWIVTDGKMETSVEGVFAAGDVRDKFLRQVVTAAGDGATAAMAAYEYLSNQYYLKDRLFVPERAYALFISGIDESHLALAGETEDWRRGAGVSVLTVDAHRNLRIKGKLGIGELPAMVEMSCGKKARETAVSSLDDVKNFIGARGPLH
ncbi:MAG: FAD-dependent oxidoreductase [Synergistaceae bacterium]|jgi:thioredoxin reductase (NADPH)|nr:FAD-dependent oxidoreductase [Synergistaceae bacterium]